MNTQDLATALPAAMAAGLSIEAIERIADHFRFAVENAKTDPDISIENDMYSLVKMFNCDVKVAAQEERQLDVHGTLEVRSPDDWTIYLANHTGPMQDRFTLAHELGHYVLHSMMGTRPLRASRTFKSTDIPNPAESEADAFALALLMPREKVLVAITKYGRNPIVLSAEFGIEPSIAEMRLASVG